MKRTENIIKKLCMLSLAMIMLFSATNPTRVYAAQDDNLTGNDHGPGGAVSGDIVIALNPTQGARATVVDITQGNKVIGLVNFLQAKPRSSSLQPIGFTSQRNWKLNASGDIIEGHLDAVYDPSVPKDNMSKEAWGASVRTLKAIADELSMKYIDPPPATFTPDILNQARYKIIIEPITEVIYKNLNARVVGTISEHLKFYLELNANDKKAWIGGSGYGIGGYMMRGVTTSTMTVKVDEILKVANGTAQQGGITTGDSGARLILGSSDNIGGLGIGIITFEGDVATTPPGVIPPAPTVIDQIIKKDFLNGEWDNLQDVQESDITAYEGEDWEALFDNKTVPKRNPSNTKNDVFTATVPDWGFGEQIVTYLGTRDLTSPSTNLKWSSTMQNKTKPANLAPIPTAVNNASSNKDTYNPKDVTSAAIGRNGAYYKDSMIGYECQDCGKTWLTKQLGPTCQGQKSKQVKGYRDPDTGESFPLSVLHTRNPQVEVSPTQYTAEVTVFESPKSGIINQPITTPTFKGDIYTQKFTLPTKNLTFYPYYKMNYYEGNLRKQISQAWMCSTGLRTATYSPEITIKVQKQPALIVAPWSRDKADTGSLKILKAGNTFSVQQSPYTITTELVYYVNDDYYKDGSNKSLSTNQDYANVVNSLSQEFKNLHMYSNAPLTGTITQMNYNKSKLKFQSSLSTAVRKKSLTEAPINVGVAAGQVVTVGRSDIQSGIQGKSGTTFNGSTIPATAEATSALRATNLIVSGKDGWYNEEYEGLIRIKISQTVTIKPPTDKFIEAYRGISDWQEKTYVAPNSPIAYSGGTVYGGKDYVVGYGNYYSAKTVGPFSMPEFKLFNTPVAPFGIRGSTFDQVK